MKFFFPRLGVIYVGVIGADTICIINKEKSFLPTSFSFLPVAIIISDTCLGGAVVNWGPICFAIYNF